jgi:hypothetical protein
MVVRVVVYCEAQQVLVTEALVEKTNLVRPDEKKAAQRRSRQRP